MVLAKRKNRQRRLTALKQKAEEEQPPLLLYSPDNSLASGFQAVQVADGQTLKADSEEARRAGFVSRAGFCAGFYQERLFCKALFYGTKKPEAH